MADTKISAETTITPLDGTELVVLSTGAANGKTTTQAIADLGGGGSPGGLTTQIQYNNAGAFGGSANLTYNGSDTYSFFGGVAGSGIDIKSDRILKNGGGMYLYDPVGGMKLGTGVGTTSVTIQSIGQYQFNSDATTYSGLEDAALGRNAAGVVEVNNATAGTFRDILTRGLRSNAVTFANAITSPVEGTIQAFTDSSTSTWGATVTGGGANHILAYYNGTNWTVMGK